MARILSTTGFGFSFNDTTGQITAVTGPATLSLSFAQDAPVISYTRIFPPDQGVLPDVQLSGDSPLLLAINNYFYGDEIDTSIGRVVWSGGTTDVILLYVSDTEQYMFRLGGAPLPNPATAQEANQFLATIQQPVGLPPAGSGLQPGADVALATLPGWTSSDAPAITTFTIDTFSFMPDDAGPQNVQPGQITFVMTDPNARLVYQSIGLEQGAGPSGTGATIARPGFTSPAYTILVDGSPITALDSDYQVFFARITTSDGTIHDVINLEFLATGRQYLVRLGGDPLPDGTNAGAAAAFFGSIASVNPIPAGAGAVGEQIALSTLPGVLVYSGSASSQPAATGDAAVLTFSGYKLEYANEDLFNVTTSNFQIALSADDVPLNYQVDGIDRNGVPIADLGATLPYAALLDGLSIREEYGISIARLVANGLDYDVLIFTDYVRNVDYVFQLDGAAPLPFATLAGAVAFRTAVDGPDGSVGVLPAGSRFAPGANFQLTDSPYLTNINGDPAFILGGDQGNFRPTWNIGRGADAEGSLTIVNGQTVTLDSDNDGPFLQIGRDAGALGTVTVAGQGSALELESGGSDTEGVSFNLGRDGGTGLMRLLDGGRFQITDPTGSPNSDATNGGERGSIGRGAGATGDLAMRAGEFLLAGTGSNLSVGRDGGTGHITLAEGSGFVMQTTSSGAQDFTHLRVGIDFGSGSMHINDSFALVQAGLNAGAQVDIGRVGNGALSIIGNNEGPFRDGLFVVGNAYTPMAQMYVGANGGLGQVSMDGGVLAVVNTGVEILREGGTAPWDAPGDRGGAARLYVGRDAGGSGRLEASAGAGIFVGGSTETQLNIGVLAGDGHVTLDAANLTVRSFAFEASFAIGDWVDLQGPGASGALTLRNGSFALFQAEQGVFGNVGRRDADNQGSIRIESGSTLQMLSDTGTETNLRVGRDGGVGDLVVTGAGSRLLMGGELALGQSGGTGSATISAGGVIENQRDAFTSLRIGRQAGSDGTLTLTGGDLILRSMTSDMRVEMGVDGGTGRLSASAGAQITLNAQDFISLRVGSFGGDGTMTVTDSQIDVRSDASDIQLEVALGPNSQGNLTLTNSELTLSAPGTGAAGQETYAWMLVGTEGGTGAVVFDNSDVSITAADGAGIRIGTRWTHVENNTGTGSVTLQNGSVVQIESGRENANLWVGGGAGSSGSASILSGSVLDMGGNGWLAVGLANQEMTPGAMTGTLTLNGFGSRTTGVQEMQVGGGGSSGSMLVTNGARAYIGGPDMVRNANADFGWGAGSTGNLTVTNAILAVQAGLSTDQIGERGAGLNFGSRGGSSEVTITGQRATNPDPLLLQGVASLGNINSAYATINIGNEGAGSVGHVTVTSASIAALNAGDVFNPDGTITQVDWGGYAAIRVGANGGTGTLIVQDSGQLAIISGADDSSVLEVGHRDGANGTFILRGGSEGEIEAIDFDAWLMIGAEGGGTGSALIADSTLHISGARNAGVRVGTSWFDGPGQTGTGALTVTDGAELRISAGNSGNFYIGGGADSQATAIIDDGARVVMDGTGHRLAIVGGTPAFLAGTGGQGSLTISGAGSELAGVRDLLVGTNGGTGSLTLAQGGRVAFADAGGGRAGEVLFGAGIGRVHSNQTDTTGSGSLSADGAGSGATLTAANLSRLIIGASGASGQAQITDGADIALSAAISAVEIGIDGGLGRLDIGGAGASLSVGGGDGRIHLGRLRYAGAQTDDPGAGILRIETGATVTVSTKVEVGMAGGHSAALVLAGGTLLAPLTELYAGTGLTSSTLLGYGQITGISGQPAVLMNGSSLFVGDDVNASGARVTGTGVLNITGHVAQQASATYFDIGNGGYDQLVVTGSYTMDGGSLNIALGTGAEALLGTTGLRLLSASGGIFLNDVDLVAASLPDGTAITTELRAGGTELWAFVDDGSAPPEVVPLPAVWRDWLDWIGGGDGAAPSAPSTGRPASTIADPHLVTFDGLGYSFHAAGEFVLTRPISGTGFEVQSRMSPVGDNASENVVMAARLDGGNVVVNAATPNSILVNGAAVTMAAGDVIAVGGDLVYRVGDTYHLIHRHGNVGGTMISTASAVIVDGRLDISMLLDASQSGQVEGLLGNYDGNQDNDLSMPNGDLVSRPLVFGDDPAEGIIGLYGVYRDAWRVTSTEQSLFTYGPGQGPDSFYLPDYPASMVTLDDFDPDARDEAAALLEASGLQPGTLPFQNALFDLLSTGNESYVAAANTQQQQIAAQPETAPQITAPPVTGGALDGLVALTGRVLDLSDAAFAGLRVTFTPAGQSVGHIRTTQATGDFQFEVLPVANGGLIEVSREYTPQTDGTITASDALNVLRIAVGLQPSFGPASPEALIAADINRSGAVTAADALDVLRAAVGLSSPNAPRWVFLDAAAELDGITANSVNYTTGITLPTLPDALSGLEMKGILLGQMSEFG
jgi:T5SS/PEP-CTERM-associated repeat protein